MRRHLVFTAIFLLLTSTIASAQTWRIQENTKKYSGTIPITISFFGVQGDYFGPNIHALLNGASQKTQVDVRSTWPDGSIAHALLTFQARINAGKNYTITFGKSPNPPSNQFRASVKLLKRLSHDVEMTINGQKYQHGFNPLDIFYLLHYIQRDGTIGRSGAWGPLLREFDYRFRPVNTKTGKDHTDIEIVLRLRVYHNSRDGVAELIVENSRTDVTPADVVYDRIKIEVGENVGWARKKTLLDKYNYKHYVQTRAMVEWDPGDRLPNITVRPDVDYLARIGLIPPLDTGNSITESQTVSFTNQVMKDNNRGSFDPKQLCGIPFDRGPIYQNMPGTGDRHDIGWYPRWSYLSLNGDLSGTTADRFNAAADANGSGMFAVHNRDMVSGEMGIKHYHPYWKSQPRHRPTTKNINVANTAHMPLLGMTSFILTGRKTFLEELVAWTTYGMRDWYPNNGFIPMMGGDRKSAWGLRNLALCVAVMNDDHPLKGYMKGRLDASATKWGTINPLNQNGTYGTGGWKASGRKSWPCGTFISPWQNAWSTSMAWLAYKLHGNIEFQKVLNHNWKYFKNGYLSTDTWTAPNGQKITYDPKGLMQYSKCVSKYTPVLDINGNWSMAASTKVSLSNWAEMQWYERIQEDYAFGSKKTQPAMPAAGSAPANWRPKAGSYSQPKFSRYDEYGPGRTALLWIAEREGLPGAASVQAKVLPWISSQYNSIVPPGARLLVPFPGGTP